MADAIEKKVSDINFQWCMHVIFSASKLETGTSFAMEQSVLSMIDVFGCNETNDNH